MQPTIAVGNQVTGSALGASRTKDTVNALYSDVAKSGRMLVINLHPWIVGWPWRSKYLDLARLISTNPAVAFGRPAAMKS